MKKVIKFFLFYFIFSHSNLILAVDPGSATTGWRAGVSRSIITPEEPTWMAGYAFRNRPSEGTLVDLWAKALALEDVKGEKVVLITADLLTFPKSFSDRIRDQLATKYGLKRSQIILNSSHTHSGPVLADALTDIYTIKGQQAEVIRKYSENLEKKIVDITGEALQSMVPANLYSGNGITRFQVNRRNNTEKTINSQTDLKGPNDYAVPVLKVTDTLGNLIAVVFGYACHPTTLGIYQFSGDYPGFAQIELEKIYPSATALFFQGAGGDQNPLPRGTISLAQQYGKELAAAVDRVLTENIKKLEPSISTAYSEINLAFSAPLSKKKLMKMAVQDSIYRQRWAVRMLETLKTTGSLPKSYPTYPVQIWKLGDQPSMALGGEIVVEYAIELKKLFGPDIFVVGYANDVMAYIPSETVLREGGYEGKSSKMVYGMPAKWSKHIQANILSEFKKLAAEVEITQITKELKQ